MHSLPKIYRLKIADSKPSESNADIRVKRIGLLPEQVLELKIPMVRGSPDSKENKDKFKKYLNSHALDPKKMAELDALEVYYSGGIAGFLDECLSRYICDFNPDHRRQSQCISIIPQIN